MTHTMTDENTGTVAISKQLSKLINNALAEGTIVPIRESEAVLAAMRSPRNNSQLVLVRTTKGYSPSYQTLGYGLTESDARKLASEIAPLLRTRQAWLRVESR